MNPLLPEDIQRRLVLASRSPRRIDILRSLGFEFRVEPAHIDEDDASIASDPFTLPQELARLKAEDVAARFPNSLVIGADTVVILDNNLMNKPKDDCEAHSFLTRLSGNVHTVVTGLTVRQRSKDILLSAREETRVRFRDLTEAEIVNYVASGEGRDKAGSYAVQGLGACLVRSIEGCYFNVVGLPVVLLFEMMTRSARMCR
ncbi:MAG: nucleoside triphosphate pyrophosphatase [Candidatus Latescibacterota bacterium]